MAQDISYKLNVATKEAEKNLKASAKEAKKLGEGLDDTRTAGKKAADFLSKFADDAQADFKANAKAAEKLAEALGSEFVAELNASGRSVDNLVDDLKRMGLTAQDVEDSVDDIAPALKKTADVGKQIDTHVTKNLKNVSTEADKSKSVMANAMGNMSQEIPGVTGAFGPLNTAIGQFAEYATEGGISIGGLVKAAGPIALVGLAIAGVSSVMAANKAREEAAIKRIESYADAFKTAREEGVNSAKVIAQGWRDNGGKIEAEISNDTATIVEFGEATDDMGRIHELVYPTAKRRVEDFGDEISDLGLTAEQFATLAQQPIDAIQRWGEEMVSNGADAKEINLIMQAAVGTHKDLAEAAKTDAVFQKLFGKEVKDATPKVLNFKDALYKTNAEYERLMGLLDSEEAWKTAQEQLWAFSDGLDDTDQEGRDLTRTLADIITTANDIPAEKKTELLMKLQQGDIKAVYDFLADIQKKRYMNVGVRFDDSVVNIGGPVKTKATGGLAGGRTLVGEAGPEIVDLPEGSYVNTAKRSEQMLKGEPATPYVDNRTFNIYNNNQTPEATARAVERAARRNGR